MQKSLAQAGDASLELNVSMCSTMEDLLKWYNTFTTNPEAVGLTKASLKNLTMPIQPLGIPGLNASFGQGIVATGTKNVTNKVRSLFEWFCLRAVGVSRNCVQLTLGYSKAWHAACCGTHQVCARGSDPFKSSRIHGSLTHSL